jgi:hypothetical protein
MAMFQGRERAAASSGHYIPLSAIPTDQVHADPALITGGIRELAAALALLGRGMARGEWTLDRVAVASGADGAVTVSAGGIDTAVFFAANGKAAAMLVSEADLDPDDSAVLVVHSTQPVADHVRSPRTRYGRTGRSGMREVDMSALLHDAADLSDLESAFQLAAAL